MNIQQIHNMKKIGNKIASLTAYDASFASVLENSGIDIILVGDSLGMVIQGEENTHNVLTDDICYHTKAVKKGASNSYIIADMPYKSYQNITIALDNAKKIINSGANMVKVEGSCVEIIESLIANNIAVCGHLGLLPQSIKNKKNYTLQAKSKEDSTILLKQAQKINNIGADLLLLEYIPEILAQEVSESINIPTIGIGAGRYCDGQILVSYDLLGISQNKLPKFAKCFLENNKTIQKAIISYIKDVKNLSFPSINNIF